MTKEIKPVHPKGNQSWIFTGRTDAEPEVPVLWPRDAKSWLIRKDPDAGKDWRQEKGTTEDRLVGWHHQLDGYEFEQALGDGKGQGSPACCSAWGHKELDMTEPLKTTAMFKLLTRTVLWLWQNISVLRKCTVKQRSKGPWNIKFILSCFRRGEKQLESVYVKGKKVWEKRTNDKTR